VNTLEVINSHEQSAAEFPQPFNILNELSRYRRLLSLKEVAAIFGRSDCTVYRWARKREIPGFITGGTWHFDPSMLVLWLQKKQPQLSVAARHFEKRAA
jgi:excisionase family DNA binding protein